VGEEMVGEMNQTRYANMNKLIIKKSLASLIPASFFNPFFTLSQSLYNHLGQDKWKYHCEIGYYTVTVSLT
jgi:hypothetical protein